MERYPAPFGQLYSPSLRFASSRDTVVVCLARDLEQGHQPGICTSPGDLAVKIVDGHKKKFAAIRHPDNDVVDSSLIEQTRDVR